MIISRGGRNLHLRRVRKIPEAWITEVRRTAHEVLFHAQQIGAIVQVMVVDALISRNGRLRLIVVDVKFSLLRPLHRLHRLLPVRVVECQFQYADYTESNYDFQQQFQFFLACGERRSSIRLFVKRVFIAGICSRLDGFEIPFELTAGSLSRS